MIRFLHKGHHFSIRPKSIVEGMHDLSMIESGWKVDTIFPLTIRRNWRYVVAGLLLFYGPMAGMIALSVYDDQALYQIIPKPYRPDRLRDWMKLAVIQTRMGRRGGEDTNH